MLLPDTSSASPLSGDMTGVVHWTVSRAVLTLKSTLALPMALLYRNLGLEGSVILLGLPGKLQNGNRRLNLHSFLKAIGIVSIIYWSYSGTRPDLQTCTLTWLEIRISEFLNYCFMGFQFQ